MGPEAPLVNPCPKLLWHLKRTSNPHQWTSSYIALLSITKTNIQRICCRVYGWTRTISHNCNCAEFLDQALRNRLVFGMRSKATQKSLLTEKGSMLEWVLELARSLKAVEKNVQMLKAHNEHPINKINHHQARVHKPAPSTTHVAEKVCYCCGRTGHPPTACSFVNAKFHSCGKIGHLAEVPWSKEATQDPGRCNGLIHSTMNHNYAQLNPQKVVWQIGAKHSHPY